MSLARWDPLRESHNFETSMNRVLRRQLSGAAAPEENLTSEFVPPVDIYEDDNKFGMKMDVPGVDTKDLDIRVDGNRLTVSGERKIDREEKKENFRRVEREYGSFSRSFNLPPSADIDNVSAFFENGTLRIDVPKRADLRAKQIKIGEGSAQVKKAA
jgi:HSP20 family protein